MQDIIESLKTRSLKATIKVSLFFTIILALIEIILYFANNAFIFFIWVPILPLIHILERIYFFKNSEFCYGKVIDVTLDDNDDVHISSRIEFIDSSSHMKHETYLTEHWGDYREDAKDEINEFYIEGKQRIGKKVPLFYRIGNPNKNIIFIDDLVD